MESPTITRKMYTHDELIVFINNNDIKSIEDFYEHYQYVYGDMHKLFIHACQTTHIDICKILMKCVNDFTAYKCAIMSNNLEVCKYIYDNASYYVMTKNYYKEIVDCICAYGTHEVFQWFIDSFPQFKTLLNNERFFNYACEYNNLDACKILYKINPHFARINNMKFRNFTQNGKFDTYLWILSKNKYYKYLDNNNVFLSACNHGNLDACKQLIHHCKKINVRTCNNQALRFATKNNHYDVCKWLLTEFPSINVREFHSEVFNHATQNNDMKMMKLLMKHCPTYDMDRCND